MAAAVPAPSTIGDVIKVPVVKKTPFVRPPRSPFSVPVGVQPPREYLVPQGYPSSALGSTVFDEYGCLLPVGHTRWLDDSGVCRQKTWTPVPGVYSPPVNVQKMRVLLVDCTPDKKFLPLLIGKQGRHFKALTDPSKGVLYIFVRPHTSIIEIWGTYPPGMDDVHRQLLERLRYIKSCAFH